MRRVLPVLLIAAALTPAATTTATAGDPVLCQGEVATIVEVGTTRRYGTDGDDVVVTDGSFYGQDGDDLICARSNTYIYVEGGPGDDEIVIEADGVPAIKSVVVLGAGDDTFTGGPGDDTVGTRSLNFEWPDYQGDSSDDVIDTFGGDDEATAGSGLGPDNDGFVGPAQTDDVDLGEGADVLTVEARPGLTAGSALVGGPGADRYLQDVFSGRVQLDLGARVTRVDDQVVARGWEGFEDHWLRNVVRDVTPGPGWPEVTMARVTGSAGADRVTLWLREPVEEVPVNIDLRGGDDRLFIGSGKLRGPVNGGDGRDVLAMDVTGDDDSRLDLLAGTYTSEDQTRPIRVSRFQDASLYARQYRLRIYLRGDAGANRPRSRAGRSRAARVTT